MATARKYFFDNTGGMRCQGSPLLLGESESILISNYILDESGHLKTRPGVKKVNNVPIKESGSLQSIVGLHQHTDGDGDRHLIACAGTKIYKLDTDINEFIALTSDGTTEVSMTSGYRYGFKSWVTPSQDYVIFGNGTTDGVKIYDPSNGWVTPLTDWDSDAPTQGDIFESFYNYMFVGDTSSPRLIYCEDPDNLKKWKSTSWFDTKTDKAFFIFGLIVSGGFLYIAHRDNIDILMAVPGSSMLFSHEPNAIKKYGIIAPHSLQNVSKGFMGLSELGVIYGEGAGVGVVSDKITSVLEKIYNVDIENSCAVNYSGGNIPRSHYFLSIPLKEKGDVAPSGNNLILVYFYNKNAWHVFKGLNANVFALGEDDNDREILYFGDDYGNVWQYNAENVYSDGDVPINTEWVKILDLGSPEILKQINRIHLFYTAETNVTLTLEYQGIIDDFNKTAQTKTISLTAEGGSDKSIYSGLVENFPFLSGQVGKIVEVNIPNVSRYLVLRFSNKELNKIFSISGFMVEYGYAGED